MNEFDTLRLAIAKTTRYMNTYLAKVVSDADAEQKGRVLVIIPALGITTPAEGVWADVEQPIGQNVIPTPDSRVSLYFLDGDPSKPVVRGRVTIVKDNVPKTQAKKQLLYKDDDTEILLDQTAKKLTMKYDGDIEITTQKKVNISVKGDVDIKANKVTVNSHLEVS